MEQVLTGTSSMQMEFGRLLQPRKQLRNKLWQIVKGHIFETTEVERTQQTESSSVTSEEKINLLNLKHKRAKNRIKFLTDF